MTRRLPLAAMALALCSALPAAAHITVYEATLNGAAEFAGNPSLGIGTATVTVDDHAFTMTVEATFSGLTGNVTASHIHCCTIVAGASTAGVATPVPTFPDFPSGVKSGTYAHSFDMTQATSYNPAFITLNGGTVASAFSALKGGLDAGTAYLNIHTSFIGSGEIRGFLNAVPVPVPEPETYALLLGGLGLVGFAARRKQTA